MASQSNELLSLAVELEKSVGINPTEKQEEDEKCLCLHLGALIYILDLRRGKTNYPQPLPVIDSFRHSESRGQTVGTMEFMRTEDISMMREDILSCMDELSLLSLGIFTEHPSLPLPHALPLIKNPKFFWPVVEKIGNQIHIFDSVPYGMGDPSWTPSHQVLDLDNPNHEWEVVPPLTDGFDLFISHGHVVVGDKIFAKHRWSNCVEFSVFDCKTRKWEIREGYPSWSQQRHLTQYSTFEYSICVERFYKTGFQSPFYIFIMFDNNSVWNDDFPQVSAIALCVTEEGDVMWTQHLPQFFDGLAPMTLLYAHVFRVDEKTMCVVMFAYHYVFYLEECDLEKVLYISTFCMDEGSQCQEGGVKVVLKERHIYKVGKDFPISPQRLRASILTFPKGRHV